MTEWTEGSCRVEGMEIAGQLLLEASVYMLDVSCEVKVGRNVANPLKWHVV